MYSQLNSAPRAPTHSMSPRVRITSAVAHPKPAVISLLCPLPGIRDSTTHKPTKSAMSMVHFKNSCRFPSEKGKTRTKHKLFIECLNELPLIRAIFFSCHVAQFTLHILSLTLNKFMSSVLLALASGKNVASTSILHNCVKT